MATEHEPTPEATEPVLNKARSIDPDFLRAQGAPRSGGLDRTFGVLLTSSLLGLLMGGVGAWVYVNLIHPELGRRGMQTATTSTDGAATGGEMPTPRLDELSGRLDQLQSRVDQLPKETAPVPDLEPIQQKLSMVDDLTRKVDAERNRIGALPEKIDQNARKISTVMVELEGVRNQLASLRSEVQPAKKAATETDKVTASQPTSVAESSSNKKAEDDYAQGVEQFQQRHYKEASETFARLVSTKTDDARVPYFAALARGFSTGDWKGETERLVKQGAGLERAGKPDKALIDAAFNGLTAASGKDWLAFYRQAAKPNAEGAAR